MKSPSIPVNKGDVYTVRGSTICPHSKDTLLFFEEFKNPVNTITGGEMGYESQNFRELLIPPAIEKELEQMVKESECIC